jgi:SWI/SNF-related matrix-associated actin-dependent regulator 1 of chromatin subfamily A
MNWDALPADTLRALGEKPHQREAVERIVGPMRGRCLLALDMGLGKTIVACVVARHYGLRTLYVVPANKRADWRAELARWVGIDAQVIKTGKDVVSKEHCVINYELARRHPLMQEAWGAVILDECHLIKEHTSLQTRAVLPCAQRAQVALLLSGTPQLSRPAELFTQISAVDPGRWGDWYAFTTRFCDGHQGPFGWEARGASNLEELRGKIEPFLIRERKSQLEGMPAKRRRRVDVVLAEDDVAALAEMRRRLEYLQKRWRESGQLGDKRRAEDHMMDYWRESGLRKVPRACDWLDANVGTDKLILFLRHKAVADGLEAHCQAMGYACMRMDGDTAMDKRQRMTEQARDPLDASVRVLLLSIDACGTGINLCPGIWRMAFVEMVWNPSLFAQAEDRIARIGATHDCEYFYLVGPGSFDGDMLQILEGKRGVNNQVIETDTFEFEGVDEFNPRGYGVASAASCSVSVEMLF